MLEYLEKYWPYGIVAAIVLSALGSALWDLLLKPTISKLAIFLVRILSFGRKRIKDGVYRRAAKGFHENSSISALFLITILVAAILASIGIVTITLDIARDKYMDECSEEVNYSSIRDCINEKRKDYILPKEFRAYTILPTVIVITFLLYRVLLIGMINSIVTTFQQYIKALNPVISVSERLLLEQKFALMDTEETWIAILSELRQIAKAAGIRLPKPYN